MSEEGEMQGSDEWLAQALLDDLGDGPTYESDINVMVALAHLLEETKRSPLTIESKEDIINRAKVIAKDYPHDFEHFAYNLDSLDKSLPPASYIHISACWMEISSSEQVIAYLREQAAEYQKECERFSALKNNGKSI